VSLYRRQVALALRAVVVRSSTTYTWFGRASRPASRWPAPSPETGRDSLVRRLGIELYDSFYVHGAPIPRRVDAASPSRSDPALIEALSSANTGRGGWEPGWRAEAVDGEFVQVARDGLRVSAPASDCSIGRPEIGTLVSLRRSNEDRASYPGFYVALGDAVDAGAGGTRELRIYFSVSAAGAAPLVGSLTRRLNAVALPFSLKVVDHPAGFARRDAAVLYLHDGDFGAARLALRAVASECGPDLSEGAPAFTKPLGRGVAVAEHVLGSGESFGASRSRLVAEGIVAAHEEGLSCLEERLEAVARCFAARDLDLDRPYLAPESSDRYDL
jgi:HopA1 effector protein family